MSRLSGEHAAFVHPDGSECKDGCNEAPLVRTLTCGCNTAGHACANHAYEGGARQNPATPINGTAWTEPGKGERVAYWADELTANGMPDRWDLPDDGSPTSLGRKRTNLTRIPGSPLTPADLDNIAKCEVAK